MQTKLFNAWRQRTASLRIALGFIALCSAAAWSQAQESAAVRAHYSGTDRDALIRAQFANHKIQHDDLLRVGSWADWEQKPAFLTFKFFAKIEADLNSSFTLKVGNVTYTANNVTGLVVTP